MTIYRSIENIPYIEVKRTYHTFSTRLQMWGEQLSLYFSFTMYTLYWGFATGTAVYLGHCTVIMVSKVH